jgi:aminodeoxyfutalosine deaminase
MTDTPPGDRPLLVNAHTHLEQSWLDPYRPGVAGDTFTNWLVGTVGTASRALGDRRESVFRAAIETGIQCLLDAGTTTVGDISGSGLSIEPLLDSGLGGIVYIEVIAKTQEEGNQQLARARAWIDRWRPQERNGLRVGLTIHTPYSVLPSILKAGLDFARKEALPLCMHAAESDEEYEWFLHGTGPVGETIRRWQMDFQSPGISPIQYLEESGALDLKPLLVHVVQVDDADIRRIQQSGSAVVHCPRSNLRLRCGRMPLEKFLAAGVPVYLGTDSLGSSPSLNVRDEIEVAVALHRGKVAPSDIEQLAHKPLPY